MFNNPETLKSQLIKKTAKLREETAAATNLATTANHAPINDLQPQLLIVHRNIADLKPAEVRLRLMETSQLTSVVNSIKRFGFIGAILVKDDMIVDGHIRLEAMKMLGQTSIPVIDVKHLSKTDCRVVAISMNRIAETGTWDQPVLRVEIIELEIEIEDLTITGFSAPQLDIIKLTPEPKDSDFLDQTPDVAPGEPVSRVGDVWAMGPHREICGDSLKPETYAELLGHETVGGVFTDSPYNCAIGGNVSGLGKVKHSEFVMASGEMSNTEFSDFLHGFLELSANYCIPGAALFACMDWRQIARLTDAAEAVGLRHINTVVWQKGSGSMGTPYRSAHELVAVFCNGPKLATDNVQLGKHGRDRTNVWLYPGANKPGSSAAKMLADHPTPKPVRLVADALLDLTKPGDLILDPFMGSGTTIIACAEVGRIARGIELDPKYVDVAVRRWIALSGEPATLVATGETFEAVAKRRANEIKPDLGAVS